MCASKMYNVHVHVHCMVIEFIYTCATFGHVRVHVHVHVQCVSLYCFLNDSVYHMASLCEVLI